MSGTDNPSVTGKLIYCGKLELLTPLLVSSGEKDSEADDVLLRDELGYPFVPATSIIGAMRHYMDANCPAELLKSKAYEFFWGSPKGADSDTKQSALYLRDSQLAKEDQDRHVIRVRDGVTINNKSGTAEDKKKFEYEVLEPGVKFLFYMEITLRGNYVDKQDVKALADFLLQELANGEISLGAKTTRGLGRCCLAGIEQCELDFSKKDDVLAWLNKEFSYENLNASELKKPGMLNHYNFSLNAELAIKNSLLIRSYSGDPDQPDAVHITSGGKAVLPATSLTGAIRARAERIANTFMGVRGDNKSEQLIHKLFGWADDKGNKVQKLKSRVLVDETLLISDKLKAEKQTRIKIDRFTGGTLKAHLFDELPLWPIDDTAVVTVNLKVKKCQDYEAGLLLLVLKDLWLGDLPLGGGKSIGRGVLQGISARICLDNETVLIDYDSREPLLTDDSTARKLRVINEKTKDDARLLLEKKVEAFHSYCANGKEVLQNEQ